MYSFNEINNESDENLVPTVMDYRKNSNNSQTSQFS